MKFARCPVAAIIAKFFTINIYGAVIALPMRQSYFWTVG